jgi:hypothetical protein
MHPALIQQRANNCAAAELDCSQTVLSPDQDFYITCLLAGKMFYNSTLTKHAK